MTTPLVSAEITTQPDAWRQAEALAGSAPLPRAGQRVAVLGCGTSWFIAQAYAARRESLGLGLTDAFAASEYPAGREYDLVVAISRSGTTTEVLDLLNVLRGAVPTLALIGDPDSPGRGAADEVVTLPFADERSVVQTRFATSVLALLRAGLGEDVGALASAAEEAVHWTVPRELLRRTQFTFLGRSWTVGLAHEAALKAREAALAWTESYPAMDYRHGPKAISDENSAVMFLGDRPEGLMAEVESTGALPVWFDEDPQVTLVRCQRFAVAYALEKGLDPDRPRNLTRSIVLSGK